MTYPTDEETFDPRTSPEFIPQGDQNKVISLLKRIQDFLGYGGRVSDKYGVMVPPGVMFGYGGLVAPNGFLLCDGKEYLKAASAYVDLYAVIGTYYGSRHATYFNVPDRRGIHSRGYTGIADKTFVPGDVDLGNHWVTLSGNTYNRAGIPIRVTTTDTLPNPLVINTTYYFQYVSGDIMRFCATRALSLGGAYIDLTNGGVGTHTVIPWLEEDRDSRLALTDGGNSGEDLGSYQPDAFQGHWHSLYRRADEPVQGGAGAWYIWTNNPTLLTNEAVRNAVTDGVHGTPRKTFETRPRNVYVNHIIKR